MKKVPLIVLIALTALLMQSGYVSAWELLDDKLSIRGNIQQTMNIRTHRDSRNVRYSSFRSMVRGEALYNITEAPNTTLDFYILGNYYWDFALDIDANQRRAIANEAGRSRYSSFKRPREQEEWLTECYFDWKYKTFQARIGKQLASWGETAESRVADLINPLDTKYVIAFPDWEDYKIGLWMTRLYWTPENMWQDLSFELLIIPFDFEAQRVPPAGSGLFFGTDPMANRLQQRVMDKQRRDAPSDGRRNFEIGLRIRGYANIGEGFDWTLSHFYTRLDSPLIDEEKGFANFLRLALGLRHGDVYTYPFYNSTAFTFSTTWDAIKSAIRGEMVYNSNRDYQSGNTGDIKERDLISWALTLSRQTMVPYLSDWNRSTAFELSLTWYQYHLLNHDSDITWEAGYGNRDSSWTKFNFQVIWPMFFATLTPVFNLVYDVNGNTTVVGALRYAPGDHWSWMCNYQQVNESSVGRYQNQVILSARYEFW